MDAVRELVAELPPKIEALATTFEGLNNEIITRAKAEKKAEKEKNKDARAEDGRGSDQEEDNASAKEADQQ